MKFKIRFADQIVGIFIILALISLVVVVVLLGRSQRWFAKDISFNTALPSAAGLSQNMPVQYKGFTIGNVKNFYLNDTDDVEVIFTIHEEYSDRMKTGSMVEIMVSPIGLGNQFLLYAGRGELLPEGSFVPVVGSAQARELIRQGLAVEPRNDEFISQLMSRANVIMDDISKILDDVEQALGPGSDSTEIGRLVGSLQRTIAGAEELPGTLDGILEELKPVIANVSDIIEQVNDPNSILYKVLDTDEKVYTSLVDSLGSMSSILDNLEKTAASQLPQIPGLVMELRTTIKTAEDVLVALTNNPLLRRGVPDRVESTGSTGPRDIQF